MIQSATQTNTQGAVNAPSKLDIKKLDNSYDNWNMLSIHSVHAFALHFDKKIFDS